MQQRLIDLARRGLALACMACGWAQAATVTGMSPQGEVAQVRQIAVKFSEGVVAFGDPRLPDPFSVSCQGAAPAGEGRWADERAWLYDFREPLPPGTRCTVKLRPEWKPSASALTGATSFSFSTGGPAVVWTRPSEGSTIEEDQHFLVQLNGPAVESSVLANVACEVEGVGERVPVRIVTGAVRDALLKAERLQKRADRLLLLACQRPFPVDVSVRLVWGAGIAAQANPAVVTRQLQRFDFHVRDAFTAEFSCERERANAPCLPIRPLSLRFSSPVSRSVAEGLRLKPASGSALLPVFDKDDKSAEVSEVRFPTPLPENSSLTIELPRDTKDLSGRPLVNAASFPLKVATGDAPPIAKFAAAPFGVVELNGESMLPLTLRHVQGDLRPAAPAGAVRIKTLRTDADILEWFRKVSRYHERSVLAQEAGLPASQWFDIERVKDDKGRVREVKRPRAVETREVSLLNKARDVRRLELPQLQGGDPRPFEVIGIPIAEPGYHVVEIESRRLGESLLDKKAPMFVRTGVLVTNLGVHFKRGRENSLVWVTTLDKGKPVADAEVAVNDCDGKRIWSGRTDAQGLARVDKVLEGPQDECYETGYLVTARAASPDAAGKPRNDLAFVFSQWHKGIEPWRFNHPTNLDSQPDVRAHTVLDRSLLRAGETVSMKHFVRRETSRGLAAVPADELPTRMKIVHQGSGQEFVQPLSWNGSRSASSTWNIPAAAKLGVYEIVLERERETREGRRNSWSSGNFRVEEFRLPLVDAKLSGPKTVPIAPKELPIGVQLSYLSGGGVAQAPARLTALLRTRGAGFSGYDEFSFQPPRKGGDKEPEPDGEEENANDNSRIVADKLKLTTDREGAATVTIKDLPAITQPSELVTELTFNDPNGEVQTASNRMALWPSAVVVGVKTGSWASTRGKVKFQALALTNAGKPIKGQKVEVRGRSSQVISSRKRMVGGFYAYDNRTETKDLGSLCSGVTDDRGLLLCEAELSSAGQVELIAKAEDAQGHASEAAGSVWVTRQGELWFAQDNDDRIDLLPEKKSYAPGETARLQVRMPFREATALVSVEREGVLSTQVVNLRGDDPTVELKIDKAWGPNVYVSVLALRGRIREVPWYSFFTWGWKAPVEWARSYWYEGREYQAPTAMVDLSKPAFKFGVAALNVGIAEHQLQVTVTPDRPQYAVRQKAIARIKVVHDGKPLAGAEIAFAAVDDSLLALRPNDSWDLLNAMVQQRSWGVETATGQSEIIGRRHYGRKAVAAGGGGGKNATRELFDTLLLWKDRVVLDANGEAQVEVPLNDSLTSFSLVAIADAGLAQFGTGSASIRVTQDLQALSGLPPLVREGDRFSAMLTLRNTTTREMKVRASLQGTANSGAGDKEQITRSPLSFPPQDVVIAAGGAKEVVWPVDVPAEAFSITWEAAAEEQGADKARDRLKVTQLVSAAVPVRVLQATLQQLDGPFTLAIAPPADGLPESGVKRGGLNVAVQPKLTGALPGMRRYFETYPFACLEQKTSKSVGLKDAKMWAGVANALPNYLDSDGLANYFPPRAEDGARGSDRLTAYLLAATNEAGFELPAPAQAQMLDGLTAFVEGRIERKFWAPSSSKGLDLDVRKLAAIEALSRFGRATPKMLGSVNLTPNVWPTAAVIDWYSILKRVKGVPDQAKRLEEAQQILRSRLTYAGTTMKFSNEEGDFWWWLMDSADANAARLILAVLDDPGWRDDLPRMVVGSLGRQRNGAWLTTTANLWGSLALDKFSAKFESVKVAGRTVATTGDKPQAIDWTKQADGGAVKLPWPDKAGALNVTQEGAGKPWLTVQSLAAIPLKAPLRAGYSLTRSVTAVEQKDKSKWSRGDILRVRVEIDAQADMTWVVMSDPVPGGATLLGSGLGRDSAIATQGEKREGTAWAAYEERSFEAFRSYYEYLPKGKHVVEYTLRLNNPGRFALPPTRVEAMYAPESFGELPNAAIEVLP
jgi:uncharacterized protein YfaS (alpha-2-macroglobulin family)